MLCGLSSTTNHFTIQSFFFRTSICQEEKPLEFEDIVDKKTYDKMRPPKPEGTTTYMYVNKKDFRCRLTAISSRRRPKCRKVLYLLKEAVNVSHNYKVMAVRIHTRNPGFRKCSMQKWVLAYEFISCQIMPMIW